MAFCAFVTFNNLSLQYNGVSFYQLMKILTTPAVIVLQLVFFKVVMVLFSSTTSVKPTLTHVHVAEKGREWQA